ncbi:MAG: hypothetical protein AB7S38_02890 [Vulcanimicrobiota bacterium]
MEKLFASQGSRFFAVRQPGQVTLYRGPDIDMRHRVNDKMAGELIRLGNNGDIFFRKGTNVYQLRRESGVKAVRPRALAHLDGSETGGTLGGFEVNVDGREFCYERVLPVKGISNKLKSLFGSKSEPVDATEHKLVLCNSNSGQAVTFHEALVDPKKTTDFRWAISPTFGFLVVAETDVKGQVIFRLIDIIDESVVSEFTMSVERIDGLRVTDNGTVMIEVRRPGEERLVLWTYSQDRHLVAVPPNCLVHHFDQHKIVFLTRDSRYLVVKGYDDLVTSNIDLSPLAEFELTFYPHFNPKGGIELLTFQNDQFRIHHTDLETLPIDATRWKLLQEQRKVEEEQRMLEEALAKQAQDQKNLETLRKSRQLEQAVNLETSLPMIRPVLPLETSEPAKKLAKPQRLEIERTPEPVAQEPPPPKKLAAPAIKPPEKPPARESTLTLETPPAPELEPPPPLAAPAPPAPAVKPAPVESLPASSGELEEELEKLRMHYIAGELGREEYYSRKKAIEERRATAPVGQPVSDKNRPKMEARRIELGSPRDKHRLE